MKVRELMTVNVGCCGPRTNAAAIAEILWSRDCGCVPIVDEKNKLLGVVTDRDLFIALGTRNRRPSELSADEVMSRDVATAAPDDLVSKAVEAMQNRKVRRVPVVDKDGTVRGMLSIYDVVRFAAARPGAPDLTATTVLSALAALVAPAPMRAPMLATAGAR
jgi:CBS domain-containing protein